MFWAVIGLGNPGREYRHTRHNAGFFFLKRLAKSWNISIRKPRCLAKVALFEKDQNRILLAMPQAYMNRSGESARKLIESYNLDPQRMLVVYDDFDLPLGKIRIRKEGSAGSHKGMDSIIRELGTIRIPRIRIGIGPLPEDAEPADFVLSPFREDESREFQSSLKTAENALAAILDQGLDAAMNRFNHPSADGMGTR